MKRARLIEPRRLLEPYSTSTNPAYPPPPPPGGGGVLDGVVLTVTGLTEERKKNIHETVQRLGGRYTRQLHTLNTTHLIAEQAESAKYRTAVQQRKIHIVSPSWLQDCARTGSRVPEKDYSIVPHCVPRTRTPVRSTTANSSTHPKDPLGTAKGILQKSAGSSLQRNLFVSCRFFFMGFRGDIEGSHQTPRETKHSYYVSTEHALFGRLIRRGRGTVLWDLDETLTHIILHDKADEETRTGVQMLERHHPNAPVVVSVSWLTDSMQQAKLLPLGPYSTKQLSIILPLPQKKRATASKLLGSKSGKSDRFRGALFFFLRPSCQPGFLSYNVEELQTLVTSNGGTILSQTIISIMSKDKQERNHPRPCYVVSLSSMHPERGSSEGDYFLIHPLLSQVSRNNLCRIVPVTPVWVHACLSYHFGDSTPPFAKERKLLETNPELFRPRAWPWKKIITTTKGSIAVAISGFVGTQRSGIVHLLRLIGLPYTENLKRSNTHLICKEPASGPKYEKAVEWELHVVSIKWLYHIMQYGYQGRNDTAGGCEAQFTLAPQREKQEALLVQPPENKTQESSEDVQSHMPMVVSQELKGKGPMVASATNNNEECSKRLHSALKTMESPLNKKKGRSLKRSRVTLTPVRNRKDESTSETGAKDKPPEVFSAGDPVPPPFVRRSSLGPSMAHTEEESQVVWFAEPSQRH